MDIYEPPHEILVLIAYVNSKGLDKPAHICSLVFFRAFTGRAQSIVVDVDSVLWLNI